MHDTHTCTATLFSPAGCPDGARCPALRLRPRRGSRTGPRTPRRGPRPRPQEGWFLSTLELFRADRKHRISHDRPAVLDCGLRYQDIQRMCRAQPVLLAACVAHLGWDPEDVIAEVVARIHARQSMPSRFDPHRASTGKYLHTICTSILTNLKVMVRGRRVGDLTSDGEMPRTPIGGFTLGDVAGVTPATPVPVQASRVGQVVRRAARA